MVHLSDKRREAIFTKLVDSFVSSLETHEARQQGCDPTTLSQDSYMKVVANLMHAHPTIAHQIHSFDALLDRLPIMYRNMDPVVWRQGSRMVVISFGQLHMLPPQQPAIGAVGAARDPNGRAARLVERIRGVLLGTHPSLQAAHPTHMHGPPEGDAEHNVSMRSQMHTRSQLERTALLYLMDWADTCLLPRETEESGLSYCAILLGDIQWMELEFDPCGKSRIVNKGVRPKVLLGELPILTGSKLCYLRNMSEAAKFVINCECALDPTATFIVRGRTRNVLSVERDATNCPRVLLNSPEGLQSCHSADPRLSPGQFATHYFQVQSSPERGAYTASNFSIQTVVVGTALVFRVMFHCIRKPFPIIGLFRALVGNISDDDILCMVVPDWETNHEMVDLLRPTLADAAAAGMLTQNQALMCIHDMVKAYKKPKKTPVTAQAKVDGLKPGKPPRTAAVFQTHDKTVSELSRSDASYTHKFMQLHCLPHVGVESNSRGPKYVYACRALNELAAVVLNQRSPHKREDASIKCQHWSGMMLAEVIDKAFRKTRRDIEKTALPLLPTLYGKVKEGNTIVSDTSATLHPFTVEKITRVTPAHLTGTILHLLQTGQVCGQGGSMGPPPPGTSPMTGAVQVLNKTNRIAILSNLTRSTMSVEYANVRNTKSRGINYGQLFTWCLSESPESTPGTVRNFCICVQVTPNPHPGYTAILQDAILALTDVTTYRGTGPLPGSCYGARRPLKSLTKCNDIDGRLFVKSLRENTHVNTCTVHVDGRPIGYHQCAAELVKQLRQLRRTGPHIDHTVSISHSVDMRVVTLTTSPGRALVPLLVVDPITQRARLQDQDKLNWPIFKLMREGYLEVLDYAEINTLTVALNAGQLESGDGGPYTHLTPHPSLLFGVSGNFSGFQQHTGSARNCLQSGHTKQATAAPTQRNDVGPGSYNLWYPQVPLIPNRLTHCNLRIAEQPLQKNCVIAISNHFGHRGMNDAFANNRNANERGLFGTTFRYTLRVNDGPGDIYGIPDAATTEKYKRGKYLHIAPGDYTVDPGTEVKVGDVLLARYSPINQRQRALHDHSLSSTTASSQRATAESYASSVHPSAGDARVGDMARDRRGDDEEEGGYTRPAVSLYRDNSLVVPHQHMDAPYRVAAVRTIPVMYSPTFGSDITTDSILAGKCGSMRTILTAQRHDITLTQDIKVSMGDKIEMASGADKGVLGEPEPEIDMIVTGDGRVPVIGVNPHAFVSRLLEGLSLEGVASTARLHATDIEGNKVHDGFEGTPFTRKDVRRWLTALHGGGHHPLCREMMYDGKTMEPIGLCTLVVLPVVILGHYVSRKVYAKGMDGSSSALFRTSGEGRKAGGGLRVGEHETQLFARHGMSTCMHQLLPMRSDACRVVICRHCHVVMHTDRTNPKVMICPIHGVGEPGDGLPSIVPYSYMLMHCELMSLGVLTSPAPNSECDADDKRCTAMMHRFPIGPIIERKPPAAHVERQEKRAREEDTDMGPTQPKRVRFMTGEQK